MSTLPAPSAPAAASTPTAVPVTSTQPTPEELLNRREKMIKQQTQKLQAEKQKFESERTKYETDYVPKSQLKDRWLDLLTEQGLTQEQIAQHLISTPNDPQTKAVMAKIKALEDADANRTKQAEADQLEQFEQVKTQMNSDVKALIANDTTFEMMKATTGADAAVIELIIEDFEKTGVLKDLSEACTEYENWLVEETYKAAQLPKVQARLKPKEETIQSPADAKSASKWSSGTQKVTVTPQVKTLSSSMPTTSSTKSTEKQRIERALAAFKGQPIT